jgi:hypothetical protein
MLPGKYSNKLALLLFFALLSLSSLAQTADDSAQSPSKNKPEDLSKWPGLLIAFGGGSGLSLRPNSGVPAFGGMKLGACCVTLDLGYDRIPGHNGFSAEISGLLPIVRLPGPQKDENRNYLRLYAEPGLGFHAGGFVGAYPTIKAMLVLFSDRRLTSSSSKFSPYIEVQRRFFLHNGQRGDFRIAAGIIWAICEHCGLE